MSRLYRFSVKRCKESSAFTAMYSNYGVIKLGVAKPLYIFQYQMTTLFSTFADRRSYAYIGRICELNAYDPRKRISALLAG
jgi:hypothetical protein